MGLLPGYTGTGKKKGGENMFAALRELLVIRPLFPEDVPLDAEYEPLREALGRAGLREETLRNMEPEERVATLEKAGLDPYDYIYLAC
jgi:hypothetical protein